MKFFSSKLIESHIMFAKRICAATLLGIMFIIGMTGCANTTAGSQSNSGQGGASGEGENGKYSNLLMSVVNDDDYKALMSNTPVEKYDIPALDPHPYAFLEDQGIDVSKILDGTYEATTMTFVYDDEPDNLYMNTRILIDDSYYQSYLLTYKLSDKEMADYRLVHGDKTKYSYRWPAFFINDKISETKQPTQVLSSKYTKKTDEVFLKHLESYVNTKKNYILPTIDPSTGYYLYLEYPRYFSSTVPTQAKTFTIAEFKYHAISTINGIQEIPEDYGKASCLGYHTQQATTFTLQDSTIFRGKDFDLSTN